MKTLPSASPVITEGSGAHNEHLAMTKDVFGGAGGRVSHSDVG